MSILEKALELSSPLEILLAKEIEQAFIQAMKDNFSEKTSSTLFKRIFAALPRFTKLSSRIASVLFT